jgi:hypothetical protein
MRLMSASIAATALITAVRRNQAPHGRGETCYPLAGFEGLIDERGGERAREPGPEHNRQPSDLIFQGHALPDQLLARDDQRADGVGRQRLHVHGLEEPGAGQMRQPSSIIAVGLVGRDRLEGLIRLPAFYADRREAELAQAMEQDRRHASSLEDDPTAARRFRQLVSDRPRRRRRLALVDDSAIAVDNADVGFVHRDIEASKIVDRTISSSEPMPILSAYPEGLPAMLKKSAVD